MSRDWKPVELEELDRWRAVPDRLRHWARTEPDRPFFRCGGDWLSFGEVDRLTDAVAGALAARGVAKGDRVALMLPNHRDGVLSVLALAKLGAIQVPLNPYLKGEFLRYQLADSGATVMISDAAGLAETARLREALPDLAMLVAVDEPVPLDAVAFDELTRGDLPCPDNQVVATDTMAVMYTSGTTGLPKGCVLSHGYYMFLPRGWFANGWYLPEDRLLTAMPMFHIAGQGMTLMASLLAGLPVTFLPSFSASGFLDECRESGATAAFGVGPMGMAVLATPEAGTDRDHRLRISIFPPMPAPQRQRFEQRFGVPVVSEAYGQTECNPITQSPVDQQSARTGSLGRPVPWLDVRLVDEKEEPVPDGEPGEVVIRPREPMVMFDGYWNNPAATVAVSRGLWHHTGDTARRDEDGYLVFFDRKKDSIRRRGENISCAEVEATIVRHPKIAAVATHAVPSPLGEDDLKAWIVTAEGARFTAPELHEFLAAELPYFAVPRYVQFTPALPVNALGRVQKFRLREQDNTDAWDFDSLGLVIARDRRR
ncbi:AMP-binding protein [Pseudonocardia spinosispora]|uniref:AMP-binding protein n=1 Tax=Pseudonocardia spinosispora TaxID=103441 RepID=UPI0004148A4D|nr:AMP-binding protein [Pseudonocardia spinosispora]